MLRHVFSVAGLVLLASAALAQKSEPPNPVPPKPAQQKKTPLKDQVLAQRVAEARFENTPLEQVMEWVARQTQLNVSVRWNVLRDAGVNRDTPVSVQASNLRMTQILWLVMGEAGGTDTRLAYRASDNVLVLSTADDLNKEVITKVYDIADLLISLPRAPRNSPVDFTRGLGPCGGSSGCSVESRSDESDEDRPEDTTLQVRKLIAAIQETIEPDTWRDNGGVGSIVAFRHALIVRNTVAVHQLLGGFVQKEQGGDK